MALGRYAFLGRPLGYSIFSLMASIRDPVYKHFSMGFRGQPSFLFVHVGPLTSSRTFTTLATTLAVQFLHIPDESAYDTKTFLGVLLILNSFMTLIYYSI